MLGFDLPLFDLDMLDAEEVGCDQVGCMMGGAADDAITNGNRDENAITDLEFYARHPERKLFLDPKIQPGEKDAVKEWTTIRDTVVRPALKSLRPASPAPSPASLPPQAEPPVLFGNAATVKAQEANDRNRILGMGLGVVAGLGILVALLKS